MANITEIISGINARNQHVFFTPVSADNFRYAQQENNLPTGTIKFASEMAMSFWEDKCSQDRTYSELPNDREMMRIISQIPGFEKA